MTDRRLGGLLAESAGAWIGPKSEVDVRRYGNASHGQSPSPLLGAAFLVFLATAVPLHGEDWPEWRGKGRLGVWSEDGILEKFGAGGLSFDWSVPVRWGYAGPAVSDGRVFVLDYRPDENSRDLSGTERLLCLDEETGRVLWTGEWRTSYSSLMASYAIGPRATPTVSGNRVYVVGATGILRCYDVADGKLIWEKNYPEDYATKIPIWGVSGAPLVEAGLLIAVVGGQEDAQVVAFDKETGEERWRALSPEPEMGYAQPIVLEHGGARQLIVWTPRALVSLNPAEGTVYWEIPFESPSGLTVATPVWNGSRLFVSQFYRGSMMVELDSRRPAARQLWKRGGRSERADATDALHALITTPVFSQSHIYGVCSYGQLRCLDAEDGDRIWETLDLIELSRWAAAFIVRNGDRYFINTDKGDLVIARFTPRGYREIDRAKLLEPTTNSAWGSRPGRPRRNDRLVNWSHPAYANRHVVARNDEKIVRVSLQALGNGQEGQPAAHGKR